MLVTKTNPAILQSAIPHLFPPTSFVAVTLLVGLCLRIIAARGDLWLDEIWSLELAQQATSPLGILTELHHDNNHFLNTLYLRLVGPGHSALAYRLAAIFCGTLSIPLAGLITRRWGLVASLTAMTLFAVSYLFVHYSSEARGYSFVIPFVLAGFESLLRFFERNQARWIVAFTLCSIGGLFSHPIFVQFSIAMALGTFLVPYWATGSWKRTISQAFSCHFAAISVAIVLYKIQWSNMQFGGGPSHSLFAKLSEAFSLIFGGPPYGVQAIVVAASCIAAIMFGIWSISQSKSNVSPLVAFGVAIPIVQVVALRPPFMFVRYYLIALIFGMLAIAVALSELEKRGRHGQWAFACLLCGFLAANTWHTINLARSGRGDYRRALEFIAATTESPRITISSDHDFGISKLIHFYGPRAASRKTFEYVKGQEWPATGPQWVVLHRDVEDPPHPVDQQLTIERHTFALVKEFDCALLSGWRWLCYRQVTLSNPVSR